MDLLEFARDGSDLLYPGGNAVIFSSVLSGMGVRSSILGQVGDDPHGDRIVEHLRFHNVDTTLLRRVPGLRTKVGRNAVSAEGNWRRLSSVPAVFPYLSSEQRPVDFDDYTHLHLGGLHGMLRAAPEATVSLLDACHERRLTISVGLASGPADQSHLTGVVAKSALVFCTLDEFSDLLLAKGLDLSDPLSSLLESDIGGYVITLGAAGSLALLEPATIFSVDATGRDVRRTRVDPAETLQGLVASQTSGREPRHAVEPVNSVGAGDVFSAVFAAAVLTGCPSERALSAAARAASLSVTDRVWDTWMARAPGVERLLGLL